MSVNRLYNASSLIEKWKVESTTFPSVPAVSTGSVTSDVVDSAIYARSDPRFLAAIEPGIRPLVLAVIEHLDCITYSSCEGHRTADGHVQVGQHVDIFAADLNAQENLAQRLDRACAGVRGTPTASLRIVRGAVSLEDKCAFSISIEIGAAPGAGWEAFEADAMRIQRQLIDALFAG
ncbi:hypothetical protein [Bradyrhizobium brasilense]|uniref:hypothetical protein n=1 Tax=Bradyrhizobium brasilense TaxID=1419277 RepID=UPI001E4A396F|nr:hypothetical protein [Bradyrhizobium brasilense]MCC8969772.1 hypothetical protein [Bradyrhizobium brasilense]